MGVKINWYVIAAGRPWHTGTTKDDSTIGNPISIGVEAEGVGSPATNKGHQHWPEVQYQSYIKGVPASRVMGHKEIAVPKSRKNDPNFSMDDFRSALNK